MVKTTREELGEAYRRAWNSINARYPRQLVEAMQERYGLHHRIERVNGEYHSWIEFPNDSDYTAFMLRFG